MAQKLALKDLDANFYALLAQRAALLTAGAEPVNPMTVSWGGVGRLWNKPVCAVYVRPQRFTFGLMNDAAYFSLSFLPESARDIVALCGSRSGRDADKVKECGLTVLAGEAAPCYAQAELTLVCRKLYAQDFDPASFVDAGLDGANYPGKDYHRMFIGEIETVLKG